MATSFCSGADGALGPARRGTWSAWENDASTRGKIRVSVMKIGIKWAAPAVISYAAWPASVAYAHVRHPPRAPSAAGTGGRISAAGTAPSGYPGPVRGALLRDPQVDLPGRPGARWARDRPAKAYNRTDGASPCPVIEGASMLTIRATGARLCDGLTRRDVLHVGGLGLLGLSLPQLQRGRATAASPGAAAPALPRGQARSCILLFLMGGPPQHSTWDPKPDAPPEIRGEFRPIATSVPGLQVGELMPRLARRADKLCVLRAVATNDNAHSSSGYYM